MYASTDCARAHAQLFEHFDALNRLCRQRFRADEVLAEEAMAHLIDVFSEDDFARVRKWPGRGRISAWLKTVARRVLTDFERRRLGHVREPDWLRHGADDVGSSAYRLLIIERLERCEAVNRLLTEFPRLGRSQVETTVASVTAGCRARSRLGDFNLPLDDGTLESLAQTPEDSAGDDSWLVAGLLDPVVDASDDSAVTMLRTLLGEDDVAILRRRFVEGRCIPDCVRAQGVDGNPYRYMKRLLERARVALAATRDSANSGTCVFSRRGDGEAVRPGRDARAEGVRRLPA